MPGVGIHHLSFAVTDLDRTVDFYRDVVGFTLRSRFRNTTPGLGRGLFGSEWDENGPEAWLELAEMELHGNRVEFIQYVNPETKPISRDPARAGSAHLAIRVQDVEKERARLQRAGVQFHSSTCYIEESDRSFWKWCQFLDPDGIPVELVEEIPPERRLHLMSERIKRARLARGLTLQEAADRGDFSAAHLSQVERGQSVPSVATLLSIATALDFPADLFLKEDATVEPMQDLVATPSGERSAVAATSQHSRLALFEGLGTISVANGIEWTKLTSAPGPVEFIQVRYEVGASSSDVSSQDTGLECGLVLEGTLLVELGFSQHLLEPGSTILYDRSLPHRTSNAGDVPAKAIWVTLSGAPTRLAGRG